MSQHYTIIEMSQRIQQLPAEERLTYALNNLILSVEVHHNDYLGADFDKDAFLCTFLDRMVTANPNFEIEDLLATAANNIVFLLKAKKEASNDELNSIFEDGINNNIYVLNYLHKYFYNQ